jgi:hypothetical protein
MADIPVAYLGSAAVSQWIDREEGEGQDREGIDRGRNPRRTSLLFRRPLLIELQDQFKKEQTFLKKRALSNNKQVDKCPK